MQKFDPANPPRRKMKYVITDSDGNQFEHYVTCVPVGIVDRLLELLGEIWGEILTQDESGRVQLKIDEALKKYPAEIIQTASLITGYSEEDIKRWDSDILVEILLDWVNGNLKGFKETWSKKKGTIGDLFGPEKEPESEPKKKPEIPLSSSERSSGDLSEPPITSSASDTPKSTG